MPLPTADPRDIIVNGTGVAGSRDAHRSLRNWRGCLSRVTAQCRDDGCRLAAPRSNSIGLLLGRPSAIEASAKGLGGTFAERLSVALRKPPQVRESSLACDGCDGFVSVALLDQVTSSSQTNAEDELHWGQAETAGESQLKGPRAAAGDSCQGRKVNLTVDVPEDVVAGHLHGLVRTRRFGVGNDTAL